METEIEKLTKAINSLVEEMKKLAWDLGGVIDHLKDEIHTTNEFTRKILEKELNK